MLLAGATKKELDQLATLKRMALEIDHAIRQYMINDNISYEEVIYKYGASFEKQALLFLKSNNVILTNNQKEG